MSPKQSNSRKKVITNSDNSDKQRKIRRMAYRIMLQKYVGEQYIMDFLKDERYVIKNEKFQKAVATARKNLGFTNQEPVDSEATTLWAVTNISDGKVKDRNDDNYSKYKEQFDEEVMKAIRSAGLHDDWKHYMREYIVNQQSPQKPLFIFPKNIWIDDVTETGELIIRLKPGIRYEDYIAAWRVFSRSLGTGKRFKKRRDNDELDIQMVLDKADGLSYRDIALKYFPKTDPVLNIEKIKKRVQRAKKRLERDK